MLADDFLRGIALDAFATGVPVRHDAGRIEHVESVIGDAADERLELAFAFRQLGKRVLTFGDIAGDLGKAYELAFLKNRINDHGGKKNEFRPFERASLRR